MDISQKVNYEFEERLDSEEINLIGNFTLENNTLVELFISFDYIAQNDSIGTYRYSLFNGKDNYLLGYITPIYRDTILTIGDQKKLEIENNIKNGVYNQNDNLS